MHGGDWKIMAVGSGLNDVLGRAVGKVFAAPMLSLKTAYGPWGSRNEGMVQGLEGPGR